LPGDDENFWAGGNMDGKRESRHMYFDVNNKDIRKGNLTLPVLDKEVFKKIGLIDERYFMYLEDVDFCLSARKAGFLIGLSPRVIVDHKQSASFKKPTDKLKISFVSHLKFILKWLKFPQNLFPLGYQLLFYPYLYVLWTIHALRHRGD
jgi:GT2 family glycosyltransferase